MTEHLFTYKGFNFLVQLKETLMKQKEKQSPVARPRQYKNRVAEIPLFMISSVQTFKRLYKIKTKMKTAFIVLVCLFVVEVKGELTLK